MTLVWRKIYCFALQAELAAFSLNTLYTWEKNLTNYNYPYLDICQAFSQKWVKWACYFQDTTDSIVASDKNQAFE